MDASTNASANTSGKAPPTALPRALRFGPGGRFELQPVPYRLLVDGEPAALGGRALDLLFVLASRPSALFGKDELIGRVWPGLVVEENNLRVQINSLRKVLGGELIVTVPGRGYRFAVPDPDAATPPAGTTPGAAPRDADPLFGRAADVAAVQALLEPGACVTVLGPPGVGKTRLARHLVARWQAEAGDASTRWVDLSPYTRDDLLLGIVARALGVSLGAAPAGGDPLPPLREALVAQPMLLVLDNAEHLARACAGLLAALGPLPALRVLVTAQVPLGLPGERLHRLQPLAVRDAAGTEGLPDDGDAAALLAHRIAALEPRFEATPALRPLLVRICRRLDGLPLALEMAAARVPTLGLQGVEDALVQRFALLSKGHRRAAARHVSLREALDWSYQLLHPAEQALLRALSVFPAGFTLELAVALAAALARGEADPSATAPVRDDDPARWDTLDNLSTLVERSLVQVQGPEPAAGTDAAPAGVVRYRLLESQRAFAAERLAARPEEQAATLRLRSRVLVAHSRARHPVDPAGAAAVLAEAANAFEALGWARRHDLPQAVRLAAALMPFVVSSLWRPAWCEALREMRPAMDAPAAAALPEDVRADWWTEFARALFSEGDAAGARDAAQRGLAIWAARNEPVPAMRAALLWVDSIREPGDELDRAAAAFEAWADRVELLPSPPVLMPAHRARVRAWAAHLRGDHETEFHSRLAEAAVARGLNLELWAQAAESNAVMALLALDRYADAVERSSALLARIEATGGDDNPNLPWGLMCSLWALAGRGDGEAARALLPRAVASARRMGTLQLLNTLPMVAQALGRWETAALLIGHAEQSHRALGQELDLLQRKVVERVRFATVATLGARRVDGLVEAGRLLTDDAALALLAPEAVAS